MANNEKNFVLVKPVLDRIEGTTAVLRDGAKEIIMPKVLLPKNTKEGDVIAINIATEKEDTKIRESKAREILNELLSAK